MTWILAIAGGLVGLMLLVALAGTCLPKAHSATRRAAYHRRASLVWEAITDVEKFPGWRSDLKSVERLPDCDGRAVWKEIGRQGAMTLERVEANPPWRLVGRIADKNLPFGGTWTYELREVEGVTTLSITEDGEIYNPVFRFLARFVFGYVSTIDKYLRDLGRKFGEEVVPLPVARNPQPESRIPQ